MTLVALPLAAHPVVRSAGRARRLVDHRPAVKKGAADAPGTGLVRLDIVFLVSFRDSQTSFGAKELAIRGHLAEGAVVGLARLDPGCPGEIAGRQKPEHREKRRVLDAGCFEYPIAGRLHGKLEALLEGRSGSLVEVHWASGLAIERFASAPRSPHRRRDSMRQMT